MVENQILPTVAEAVKLIVVGGIGGAVASCIGNWFVNKKLQIQKHAQDKQLESLKNKFGKKNTIHSLQFEKEFQLYGELWKALIVVRKTAIFTTTIEKADGVSYEEKLEKADAAFNHAKDLFEDHRPFYHETVGKTTKELLSQCRRHLEDVRKMLKSEEFKEDVQDQADELLEKVPAAIDEIEKAIKERVGLLQEAEIVA